MMRTSLTEAAFFDDVLLARPDYWDQIFRTRSLGPDLKESSFGEGADRIFVHNFSSQNKNLNPPPLEESPLCAECSEMH